MRRAYYTIALILAITALYCQTFSDDETIEKDQSDAQIEAQNQAEMMTMLQSTSRFRYGNNLDVGDNAHYICTGDSLQSVDLEVVEKNADIILIKEQFDGNTLFVRWDSGLGKILDCYGFDEDNQPHHPDLLTEAEVQSNLTAMHADSTLWSAAGIIHEQRGESGFMVNGREIRCREYDLYHSQGDITPLHVLKSAAVPKLVPFVYVTLSLIGNEEILQGQDGFVKFGELELSSFNKHSQE